MPKIKSRPKTKSKEERFELRLLHDQRFLQRIESARQSLRAGRRTRLEDVKL
jgi:hypothetical protein